MDLLLQRHASTEHGTLGQLFVNGAFKFWTLEPDEDRPQHPAIPVGRYKVIITYSTRFQRLLPLVINVPGRLGIRIHPGNTDDDTEGCILLGTGHLNQVLQHSREACAAFQSLIAQPLAQQDSVWLTVSAPDTGARLA